MEIHQELRKVLETIADMTQSTVDTYVYDTVLIKHVNLTGDNVQKYLKELKSLGLIEISQQMTGADFALVNITKEGLRELSKLNQHSLR